MLTPGNYEENYSHLQFEDVLRAYRDRKILEVFKVHPHKRILEIGCGFEPLFKEFRDFEKMVAIEPGDTFFKQAYQLASGDGRITVIHNLFENVIEELRQDIYDVIVVGGFLHEIDNPGLFVNSIKQVCSPQSIVHSYVPNANSFHRLLALEMGIIEAIYQMSDNDILFQRRTVFDHKSFVQLFQTNGFDIEASGSYFIKPFTHLQMDQIITNKILNAKVMDGLDKMIKYMPDLGAELFVTGSVRT